MFQVDGPIWRFLSILGDLIILHVIWLLCCLPVFTIGPATAAAHFVTLKLVRDEGRAVIPMFFRSFRKNFKQGVLLGTLFTGLGFVLGLDLYLCIYVLEESSLFQFVMLSALGFLAILYLMVMIYLWAVLAFFENTSKQTVRNALLLAIKNSGDTSVMLAQDLLIGIAAVLSLAFVPQLAVLFHIFGVPLVFAANSFRLRKIFDEANRQAAKVRGRQDGTLQI